MALIEVQNLTKSYKTFKRKEGLKGAFINLFKREYEFVQAVDKISFHVEQGEILGYIGPNGAGKSTTIKILTGILTPTDGKVAVNGLVPYKQRQQHVKNIGVVFGQRTQLWWDIAVIEAFTLLRDIYEVSKTDFQEQLKKFKEVLGIGPLLHIPVRKLSLGQRVRCDIAASLLHNPPVVFLDEPTIGLDVAVKSNIREFIKEMNASLGTTMILTTHDLSDIEYLCQRSLIIDQGKIIFDGDLQKAKDELARERKIQVDLYERVDIDGIRDQLKIAKLEFTRRNDYSLTISFDKNEISAIDIIQKILDHLHPRDIKIEEPTIETVVKEIYQKKSF
ncbi:MAG: ATP-binding cassette domain-containing protein [Candidatus Poribacteria bacterium]|nr:ATP-binding cassette domain-containing protein [Candidatus Poribacteria bacterium]